MTEESAQARYTEAQRDRGLSHVRVWVPAKWEEYYKLMGQRLREAHLISQPPDLPKLFETND